LIDAAANDKKKAMRC